MIQYVLSKSQEGKGADTDCMMMGSTALHCTHRKDFVLKLSAVDRLAARTGSVGEVAALEHELHVWKQEGEGKRNLIQ